MLSETFVRRVIRDSGNSWTRETGLIRWNGRSERRFGCGAESQKFEVAPLSIMVGDSSDKYDKGRTGPRQSSLWIQWATAAGMDAWGVMTLYTRVVVLGGAVRPGAASFLIARGTLNINRDDRLACGALKHDVHVYAVILAPTIPVRALREPVAQ